MRLHILGVKINYDIMKALFLFNPSSGKKSKTRKINKIMDDLRGLYDVFDFVVTKSRDDFIARAKASCGVYDVLLFAGGDGTFNMVVNALANEDNRPILGAFPTGTVNDLAKNFGLNKKVKKSLVVLKENNVVEFDIVQAGDQYFGYTAAIGLFANIPYDTKVKKKSIFGRLAYYFKGIRYCFSKKRIEGTIDLGDQKINFKCPFLIVLNSKYIGGFKINKHSNNHDGKVDIMFTEKGMFNGLFRFLMRKKKIKHYQASRFKIDAGKDIVWDYDGEKGNAGPMNFKVLPNHLKIFAKTR